MKTLKAEEVNGKAYDTLDQARREIGAFIETVYNAQRLHSALSSPLGPQPNPQPPTNSRNRLVTELAVSHRWGAVQNLQSTCLEICSNESCGEFRY